MDMSEIGERGSVPFNLSKIGFLSIALEIGF